MSDWSVDPGTVSPGETVTIAGWVDNIGDETGTDYIDLYVGGVFVDSRYITLDPYYCTQLSFEWSEDFPGIYEVMVNSNADTWWGEFEVVGEIEWLEIYDWHDLNDIRNNLNASYIHMNDLTPDTAGYLDYNDPATAGWLPIGDQDNRFKGIFDGQNHTISGLYINRPGTDDIGLFGAVSGGEARNIAVVDVDVSGREVVGGLVGDNRDGTVSNSYATGTVNGDLAVGRLVGWNYYGTVSNSYATGNVSGEDYVGGLVGLNDGTVENSYSTGTVIGTNRVGGLVGYNYGTVSNSYATGDVSGEDYVGGLVGYNWGMYWGTVSNSYATGDVSGTYDVGGLVGYNGGTVSNSYAMGTITRHSGSTYTTFGGFVGINYQGKITNCYSTGSVHYEDAADPTAKGFAGSVDTGGEYEMSGNFWDVETSGQTSTAGNAIGKNTTEMMTQSTFEDAGWDFDNIWKMIDGETYPLLWWQPDP